MGATCWRPTSLVTCWLLPRSAPRVSAARAARRRLLNSLHSPAAMQRQTCTPLAGWPLLHAAFPCLPRCCRPARGPGAGARDHAGPLLRHPHLALALGRRPTAGHHRQVGSSAACSCHPAVLSAKPSQHAAPGFTRVNRACLALIPALSWPHLQGPARACEHRAGRPHGGGA